MRRSLRVALVLVVAILGACGDDDGDAGGDTTTTEASSDTTTEAEGADDEGADDEGADDGGAASAGDEEDQAIAEAALLTEADLPEGWTSSPSQEDDEGPDADDCPLLAPYEGQETAKATSDEFERDNAQVNLTVVLFAEEDEASGYIEDFGSDETDQCLQDLLREAITEQLDSGADTGGEESGPTSQDVDVEVTSEPAEVEGFGDDAAGYRVTMAITAQDTVELHGEFTVVRVGRALAQFTFLDVQAPLTDPRDTLIETTVERLEAELG